MGICTSMKTAEITRLKAVRGGGAGSVTLAIPSTWELFANTFREGGIRAVNKGVNAVALRQMTGWGPRIGMARWSESAIREVRGLSVDSKIGTVDKVLCSTLGGIVGCWNHPIEVVRIEMQSLQQPTKNRPAKPTIANTLAFVYKENGIPGLFRGFAPRVALSVWRTICLVTVADLVKDMVWKSRTAQRS
ncbi:mitochondrial carrier [Meredithblackwellia eburnea MCA 4105]